jgi:hypothetical protein
MLTAADLYSLEEYSRIRPEFKEKAIAHKRERMVSLGDHVTLFFEDALTIKYQIQEMLRIEKAFEQDAIQDELNAYNPLIPTGTDLKATMMIEYGDAEIRKKELSRLRGIENRIYIQVQGHNPVFAVADSDMERSNGDKTSAVHFLEFNLTKNMIKQIKEGKKFILGIDHDYYEYSTPVEGQLRNSLSKDFNI